MNKKYNLFLTALFCLFLGGFSLWHLAAPDSDFSANENRYLAKLPTPDFTIGTLTAPEGNFFSGEFMEDFESYVNDQFPLRDSWVELKARMELLSGKHANNSVYFTPMGLVADFPTPNENKLSQNFGYVAALGEKLDIPVYFSLIPGKSEEWKPLLPSGAPAADQSVILEQAAQTPNVTWVDMDLPMETVLNDRAYPSFYATDHHWTTAGAYQGYVDLMEGMGLTVHPLEELTTVSEDFYGTTWSKAGAYWVPGDSMEIGVSDEGVTVTNNFNGTPTEGKLYNYENLEKKDKYTFFLGGNQPLCIVNSDKEDAEGRLLVIRDSFSDSLTPFLTQNFEEIHLLDLRYYKAPLGQYLQQNRIDSVLVLYSVDNFASDGNLFVLGM